VKQRSPSILGRYANYNMGAAIFFSDAWPRSRAIAAPGAGGNPTLAMQRVVRHDCLKAREMILARRLAELEEAWCRRLFRRLVQLCRSVMKLQTHGRTPVRVCAVQVALQPPRIRPELQTRLPVVNKEQARRRVRGLSRGVAEQSRTSLKLRRPVNVYLAQGGELGAPQRKAKLRSSCVQNGWTAVRTTA